MKRKTRQISATLIAAIFAATNTFAVASDISGIQANNGVYNINPQAVINNTKTGYRTYKNFNLDKGNVANLNYEYGRQDINTFVNMVDNKININGIVNSVKNNNFYNGKAVFISPNDS